MSYAAEHGSQQYAILVKLVVTEEISYTVLCTCPLGRDWQLSNSAAGGIPKTSTEEGKKREEEEEES